MTDDQLMSSQCVLEDLEYRVGDLVYWSTAALEEPLYFDSGSLWEDSEVLLVVRVVLDGPWWHSYTAAVLRPCGHVESVHVTDVDLRVTVRCGS